ncbi:Retrovirus-related Pol poly from transposon opus [Paramuricea clavata]|uniref:Retrovirus-related Pol poly from transposon opus n=1 Tax=Paramuricea clavata TaxID=317549 RepID=A0A7D9IRQ8_PARCT|nr:Retrovirus-related Pol poly from transposon opus [Paramuricea clavata]
MSHEIPSRPWQRIAAHLFEHAGRTYLVTTDYFSDFFELDFLRSTTSTSVIKKLKAHFSRHGIPEQLVTDNGPQFVSCDFVKFANKWDFEHFTNSPRHSQANGKAESAVKEAKKIIMKCNKASTDTFIALLDHRNTPSAVKKLGNSVRIKRWKLGKKEWQLGSVRKRLDERPYEVQTPCGILRKNRIHLRKSTPSLNDNDTPSQNPVMRQSDEPTTSTTVIVPVVESSFSSTTSTTILPSPANEQESTSSRHTEVQDLSVCADYQRIRKICFEIDCDKEHLNIRTCLDLKTGQSGLENLKKLKNLSNFL